MCCSSASCLYPSFYFIVSIGLDNVPLGSKLPVINTCPDGLKNVNNAAVRIDAYTLCIDPTNIITYFAQDEKIDDLISVSKETSSKIKWYNKLQLHLYGYLFV